MSFLKQKPVSKAAEWTSSPLPPPCIPPNYYKVDEGALPGVFVHFGCQLKGGQQEQGIFIERMAYEKGDDGGYLLNAKQEAKVKAGFASLFFTLPESLNVLSTIAHILKLMGASDEELTEYVTKKKPV